MSNSTIANEPQKLARFTLYGANPTPDAAYIGLEYRGGVSQNYPKKSYGVSFLKGNYLPDKTSQSLMGWAKNEDWILNAVYSDASKVRNQLSFELWQSIQTQDLSSRGRLVELYFNNEYRGVYSLSEQMNAEKLNLESGGVLYKATDWGNGATAFEQYTGAVPCNNDRWEGWEQKYPKPKYGLNWEPLHELRVWAVRSTDNDFINQAAQQVDLDNLIDYYLFVNLIGASDNHGKNTFWTRPNSSAPLSIVPWDLDATWGQWWNGEPLTPDYIIGNSLFDRLLALNPNNFRQRLKTRWANLRAGPWTAAVLETYLNRAVAPLLGSDVVELERSLWQQALNIQQERDKMWRWMQVRLGEIDAHVAGL